MLITLFIFSGIFQPYYHNPKIHNFGNVGIGGKFHAEFAPIATKIIDIMKYDSINIREKIIKKYENKKILDLCCGIGISTSKNGIGVDTSHEMLKVASKYNKNSKFYLGNAEYFNPNEEIDIVTCMFAFHEIPYFAQMNIVMNALEIAKEKVIIIDISPNYKPKKIMLDGEPYLLDYLSNIERLLINFEKKELIKNHVTLWEYNKI